MSAPHRIVCEATYGPLGDLVPDHLCRVTLCVNPAHLEPVTIAENLRRSKAASIAWEKKKARTHCKNGHPYAGGNLGERWGGKGRKCIECTRRISRESAKRLRNERKDAIT